MRSIQRSVSLTVGLLLLGMAFAGPPRARAAAPGQGAPRSAADKATLHLQPLKEGEAKRIGKKQKKKKGKGTHQLRGQAINPDGSPADGVLVQASGQAAHSDEQGRFKLNKLPAGAQVVHFIGQRHEVKKGKVDVQKDQEVLAPVTLKPVDPYRPEFEGPIGRGTVGWLRSAVVEPPRMNAKHPPKQIGKLNMLSAPGQSETRAVAFFANRDLPRPEAKIAWSGPDAEALNRNTRVRWTQRRLRRLHSHKRWGALLRWRFLFNQPPDKVKHGQLRQLVLSVNVPDDAPAGTRRGRLTLTSGGRTLATLPLTLRITAFRLAQPDKRVGIYYQFPLSDADQLDREMKDLRAHGVSILINGGQMAPQFKKDKNGDVTVRTTRLRKIIEIQQRHGFQGPYSVRIFPPHVRKAAGLTGHRSKQSYQGMIHSDKYKKAFHQAIDAVDRLRKEMGVKIMLLFGDEVQRGNPVRMKEWLYNAKLARQFTDDLIYLTVNNKDKPTVAKLKRLIPYVDIPTYFGYGNDVWLARGHTFARMRDQFKNSEATPWVYYNIWGGGHSEEITRLTTGFWLWRSPFQASVPYIYHWPRKRVKDPADTLDSHWRDMGYAFPAPKTGKLLATLDWAAYGQGYNDLRYVATLNKAIAQAPPNDPQARAARAYIEQWDKNEERANHLDHALTAKDYRQRRQRIVHMIDALRGQ